MRPTAARIELRAPDSVARCLIVGDRAALPAASVMPTGLELVPLDDATDLDAAHAALRRAVAAGFRQIGVLGLRPAQPASSEAGLASARTLCAELLEGTPDTRIFALDPGSDAMLHGLFGRSEAADWLGVPLLGAIVVPLVAGEIARALSQIAHMDRPGFTPHASVPAAPQVDLIYCFAGHPDPELERQVNAAYGATLHVRRHFRRLRVVFAGLTAEQQRYVRTAQGLPPADGYKAGPNNLYFGAMKAAGGSGFYALLMETDVVAVRPGWLADLEDECRRNYGAWLIGSHYRGFGPMSKPMMRHINGNALYALGFADFQQFLWQVFEPWLRSYVAEVDPVLAYDCGWDVLLQLARSDTPGDRIWPIARRALHRFRYTERIVNIGGELERTGIYQWSLADIRERFPLASLVHAPLVLEHRPLVGVPEPPMQWRPDPQRIVAHGMYFNRYFGIGRAQTLSPNSGTIAGTGDQDHLFWSFGLKDGPFAPGDVVVARVTVRASALSQARLMLASLGEGPYERSGLRVSLGETGDTVELLHTIRAAHELLRVQIGPATVWHEPVLLTIDTLNLTVRRAGRPLGTLRLGTAPEAPQGAAAADGSVVREFADDRGGRLRLTLPRPAARDSCFAIGVVRGGSTLLNGIVTALCRRIELPTLSIDNQLHQLGFAAGHGPRHVYQLWYERGYCFNGIRRFDTFFETDFFRHGPTKILLVRDPRDIATSLYFATRKSQPGGAGAGPEAFLAAGGADLVLGNLRRLASLPGARHLHWFRYEDVIYRKAEWIGRLGEILGGPLPQGYAQQLAARFEVFPETERPDDLIRQARPGNFRKHLGPEAAAALTRKYRDIFEAFGYDTDA